MDLEFLNLLKRHLDYPHPLDFKEKVQQYINKQEEDLKKKHYLVTINWDSNSHSVDSLQKPFNKILQKKWLKSISYTHEQRGETLPQLGKGYHIHLLIEDVDKTSYQVHKEIFNTVKDYVGNSKHVDVQSVKNDWLQDKRDYISGLKFDTDKEAKLNIDVHFRKQFNLKNSLPVAPLPPPPL